MYYLCTSIPDRADNKMESGRNKNKKQITQTCRTSLKSMTTRHGRNRRTDRQTDVGAYEEFVSLVTAIKIWTNPARVSHTNYHNLQIFQRKRPPPSPPTTASKQQEQKFLLHQSGSWGQQRTSAFLSFYCHWVRLKEKASRDRWFNFVCIQVYHLHLGVFETKACVLKYYTL